MKKFKPLLLLLITCGVMSSNSTFAQVKCDLLQVSNADAAAHSANMTFMVWGLSGLGFYSIYEASKGA